MVGLHGSSRTLAVLLSLESAPTAWAAPAAVRDAPAAITAPAAIRAKRTRVFLVICLLPPVAHESWSSARGGNAGDP